MTRISFKSKEIKETKSNIEIAKNDLTEVTCLLYECFDKFSEPFPEP